MTRTLVIGLGQPYRGDDAIGLEVVTTLNAEPDVLETLICSSDPSQLLEIWTGRRTVIVDAVHGEQPGRIHVWGDLLSAGAGNPDTPVPAAAGSLSSSHILGLVEVIELAQVLDRLPLSLTVIGVEGQQFGMGMPVSPAVMSRIDEVVATVRALSTEEPAGPPLDTRCA